MSKLTKTERKLLAMMGENIKKQRRGNGQWSDNSTSPRAFNALAKLAARGYGTIEDKDHRITQKNKDSYIMTHRVLVLNELGRSVAWRECNRQEQEFRNKYGVRT